MCDLIIAQLHNQKVTLELKQFDQKTQDTLKKDSVFLIWHVYGFILIEN